MSEEGRNQIHNSALWAAYGDALGFITELVSDKALKKRIGRSTVSETVAWESLVGGSFGAKVSLPAGCYSDDTQLRLATSRAIRGDGGFDVEAFAKIELSVWLAYALGGGRGTKLAAISLRDQNINWFNNFFDRKGTPYIQCGGNGAAMRIQPHVWAAVDRSKPEGYIVDVVRNALCTHGHPRGIFGAVFHALCLAAALEKRSVPGPDSWRRAAHFFPSVVELIRQDVEINTFWLPPWEKLVNESIGRAVERVMNECLSDIDKAERHILQDSNNDYGKLVQVIGGFNRTTRGSGTKTAIIAAALSWMFRRKEPTYALRTAANTLLSDTDTIATMAGAILGVVSEDLPRDKVLDRAYIGTEARRLARIAHQQPTESFGYPDLLNWTSPKTQLEVVGSAGDYLVVRGLARAKPQGRTFKGRTKDNAIWQWLGLEFGQSIFAKRRLDPQPVPSRSMPVSTKPPKPIRKPRATPAEKPSDTEQGTLFPSEIQRLERVEKRHSNAKTLHEITTEAIKSDFDPMVVGRNLLELSMQSDGIEKAVAFAAIIAKAKVSRAKGRKDSN